MSTAAISVERSLAYSPLSFLRDHRAQLVEHVEQVFASALASGEAELTGGRAAWLWRRLNWDSDYFGLPVIRIDAARWDGSVREPVSELAGSLRELLPMLHHRFGKSYIFAELPSEDVMAVQALGHVGFGLVETRVTYFTTDTIGAESPDRWAIRVATTEDIPHLREVAAEARNPYDRYHADPFFGDAVADAYLATYAEASIAGLATAVLVPDDDHPPGAFFSTVVTVPPGCPLGLDHACKLGFGLGRIPLVAVGSDRKGCHRRLLAETTRYLAQHGAGVVAMTTQAPNRSVIRNCEKLGFRLGRVSHVFSMEAG